ncbi:MAG: PA0069 family radical SAM protein [Acidobacteriota bacterium]|nr:PA0069 family radical SAM protein [Acidobacteriota bacterium]
MRTLPIRGRGAAENPANRFVPIEVVPDPDAAIEDDERGMETRFFEDSTRSIISRNDSPDVGFDASVNPYRGCEVGCIYCYARTFHEYLGFSAGLDFETRILVKKDAPELLREELASPRWKPQVIALSGATDPYQPIERALRLTRGCLEILAEARNPVQVVTKRDLVVRDIDLLGGLSAIGAASVHISVTTLDQGLQRVMEPRGAAPYRRIEAIRRLAGGGVRVGVNVAPVIPGLTDHEVPSILEAAREAGAMTATYILLRLPFGIRELFDGWLERHFPDRREKVMGRVRETRAGRLYDPRFAVRGRGVGEYATQIHSMFRVTAARLGYETAPPPLSAESFRAPRSGPQLGLFDGV